jgi:glycosyltransferase involved in cell wall biosynthesis
MTRVLHIVPALFGGPDGIVGGAERYALELARHMATRTPTRLLTFGDRVREVSADGLVIRVAGPGWRVRGQRTNPVAAALFGEVWRADVIHCHQQHVLASTLAALTARVRGRKVFVSELGGGGWDVSAYVSTDRLYHGHLHLSDYSRRVHGHERLARAHVIYGGVDLSRFTPDPIGRREPRAVFVGRLLPHKGVHDLIRALPAGLALDVIGRPYDDRYLRDLQGLAAGKAVRFRHDATDDDLVAAYRAALCVVLPSVYIDPYGGRTRVPELLGQSLLEGMACGAPAVATDVASLPEIVTHGVNGLLVPPGDPAALGAALDALAHDPVRVAAMSRAARQTVEQRFTWDGVVDRCLAIYAGEHREG